MKKEILYVFVFFKSVTTCHSFPLLITILAFKYSAELEKINWGFIRDRNNSLYINNTEYT